jgi:Protein of unknown function (DUF1524)
VNDSWKTVYEFLGREPRRPLEDDDFLRAHWSMYFTYSRDRAGKFSSFLLDDHFTPDRVIKEELKIEELQRYVTSVQRSVKQWHAINFPHLAIGLTDDLRLGLERLKHVGYGAFEPLVMAALQKNSNASELHGFLSAAERFVFVVGRLCARRSDTGDSEFYRLAGELHRDEKTLPEVTNIIKQRTKEHFSLEKAQVEMRDLFDGDQGFYDWSGLNYFLFEYEQRLKVDAGMQAAKINWDEFTTSKRDHVTVEHIYPRSPVLGHWPEFEAQPSEKRTILHNSLGNLLALSQSKNSRLSNRPFHAKKQDIAGARGYFNGSYSEIEVSKESSWTPGEILERGLKMHGFLEERWIVSLGARRDKVRLLHLEFLEPVPATATTEHI